MHSEQHPEYRLIHCILRDSELLDRIKLEADDFLKYRIVWDEIMVFKKEARPIGFSSPFSFDVLEFVPQDYVDGGAFVDEYCYEIRKNRIIRDIKNSDSLKEIRDLASMEYMKVKIPTLEESVGQYLDNYCVGQERIKDGYVGIRTGFKWFDMAVVLDKADLITLAGRPGQGKSSLALSLALGAAKYHKVLFLSLEMTQDEMIARAISSTQSIPLNELTHYMVNTAPSIVAKFFEQYKNFNIFHYRNCHTKDIAAIADNYDIIFIDQLSNLRDPYQKGESKAARYGRITQELKAIAIEQNIAVVLCAQINRAGAENPDLTNLKDSGSIEEDSDIVVLIQHDSIDNSTKLICAKNRNGEANHEVEYRFEKKFTRFIPIS